MLLGFHACTLVGRYRTTEDLAAVSPPTPSHTLSPCRLEKEGTQTIWYTRNNERTRHQIPEDGNLDSQGRRTLKSYFIRRNITFGCN